MKFLKKSKQWPVQRLEKRLAELKKEQRDSLTPPWAPEDARRNPKGAKAAWVVNVGTAQTKLRCALGEASKTHDRLCVNSRSATREQARRLGRTGRVFMELLGSRRTNGTEILAIGEGGNKEYLYTADTVHRALSGCFDKHLGAGRKSGTTGQTRTLSS